MYTASEVQLCLESNQQRGNSHRGFKTCGAYRTQSLKPKEFMYFGRTTAAHANPGRIDSVGRMAPIIGLA